MYIGCMHWVTYTPFLCALGCISTECTLGNSIPMYIRCCPMYVMYITVIHCVVLGLFWVLLIHDKSELTCHVLTSIYWIQVSNVILMSIDMYITLMCDRLSHDPSVCVCVCVCDVTLTCYRLSHDIIFNMFKYFTFTKSVINPDYCILTSI